MKVDLGACRMNVRESGSGPVLLLGHSLTFDGSMWDAQREALSDRARVIAVDLRGHGGTEWPDPEDVTLDALADDLARLCDALSIARVTYAGLSLGGMVGMRFARRHPDRVSALGLFNTSAEPEPQRPIFHQFNEASRGQKGNAQTAGFVLAMQFSRGFLDANPETEATYLSKIVDPPDPDGLYHVAKAVIWRQDIRESLDALDVPTLVVTSEGDTAIAPVHGRRLAEAIPGARLVTLEGCGHMTAVERPERVSALLAELLGEGG